MTSIVHVYHFDESLQDSWDFLKESNCVNQKRNDAANSGQLIVTPGLWNSSRRFLRSIDEIVCRRIKHELSSNEPLHVAYWVRPMSLIPESSKSLSQGQKRASTEKTFVYQFLECGRVLMMPLLTHVIQLSQLSRKSQKSTISLFGIWLRVVH